MLSAKIVFDFFKENGIVSYSGVPDSLLKHFCSYISEHCSSGEHIISANEGNAIAIAAGKYLGTNKPSLVYLQNSGLGNIVNPIISLADSEVYGIPMLLMIGWRGQPGVKDEPQHLKQGRITTKLLDSMEIPWFVLGPDSDDHLRVLDNACKRMKSINAPVAILVKKGTFEPYPSHNLDTNNHPFELSREDSIKLVIPRLPEDALVVSTTGMTSREVFEHRVALGQGHGNDFLTVGSMGHASSIALGLSISNKNRTIVCLDGDGAMLMHLGSVAVLASHKSPNFLHILINNGAHDSVGGQPTVGLEVDMSQIARSCGYQDVASVSTTKELEPTIDRMLHSSSGPNFLEIKVKKGARSDLGRPTTSPLTNKNDFMAKICI